MRIGVLGYGSFGLVISAILSENGHYVIVWGRNPERIKELSRTRKDEKRLKNFVIPDDVKFTYDLKELDNSDLIVSVLPSHALLEVYNELATLFEPSSIISLTKGFVDEEQLPADFIKSMFPHAKIAVLSGPNIARELAKKLPTSSVIASHDMEYARFLQTIFARPYFRIYIHDDVRGVELGGALKNVLAIAAGMVDGLGLGMNAKGALLTRGIAEMRRLALALGAKSETLMGLAGYGDLITTSFSKDSRNRTVGELLAKGQRLKDILRDLGMVAEGIRTSDIVLKIADKLGIDMPITRVVNLIVNEKICFDEAVNMLLSRPLKEEFYDRG